MTDVSTLATGSRAILRRLHTSDLSHFQAYRTDPEVATYQSWEVNDECKARRFLEAMSKAPLLQPAQWCQIAIALADTNRLIGDIGICLDADGAATEVGITLSPARQHSGLAGEATVLAFGWIFATCPATRIYGIADQRNIAAVDLMDRLGMVFEEEYETEFEGEPCNEIRHAMVRERFMELHERHRERRR